MAPPAQQQQPQQYSLSSDIRWCRHYIYAGFRDCCRFHLPSRWTTRDYVTGCLPLFLAKFLLEVLGAAGAIWGSSEVLLLRNTNNTAFWRIVSLHVLGIFVLRYWWHSRHFLHHQHEFPPIKVHHRRIHKVSFLQIFVAKFVLEVLGAAGAIWGPSEALTLRTQDTTRLWRLVAASVLVVFGLRWVWQILTYCLCIANYLEQCPVLRKTLAWCDVLVARFVLVVLGAIGAVWGFSEIVELRQPESNNHVWRPIALVAGVVFFVRWLLQTRAFAVGLWDDSESNNETASPSRTGSTPSRAGTGRTNSIKSMDIDTDDGIERQSSDLDGINDLELCEEPTTPTSTSSKEMDEKSPFEPHKHPSFGST